MPSVGSGSRIPPGGASGDVLRKKSVVDFDLDWFSPTYLKGDPGPTPVFKIGTVTNVGTAGPPTVTISGTPANPILSFGLQQGPPGTNGTNGMTPAFTATATGLPSGSAPTASVTGTPANPVLNLGIPKGDAGAPGTSPVFSIGNVANVGPAGPPKVTMRGTALNPILDFGLQQGLQGLQGMQGNSGVQGQKGDKGDQGPPGPQGNPGNGTFVGPVRTANYTATANEVVLVNAGSVNLTVTMPIGVPVNTVITIRRVDSNSNNNVFVKPGTAQTIDGHSGVWIFVPNGSLTFQFDGNSRWYATDVGPGWYNGVALYPSPGSVMLDFARTSRQISIPDSTWTMVTPDVININMYNCYTNAYVFTAPWQAWFEFTGQTAYEKNTIGNRFASFSLNPDPPNTVGSLFGAVQNDAMSAVWASSVPIPPHVVRLNAGDTVALYAWQNAGKPILTPSSTATYNKLTAKFVIA